MQPTNKRNIAAELDELAELPGEFEFDQQEVWKRLKRKLDVERRTKRFLTGTFWTVILVCSFFFLKFCLYIIVGVSTGDPNFGKRKEPVQKESDAGSDGIIKLAIGYLLQTDSTSNKPKK